MKKCHCSGVHAGLTCACTPMVDVTDPPPPPQVACPSASGAGVFFLTVRRPHPWLPRGRIGRGPPAGRVLNSCRLRGLFGFSLPDFQPIGDGALPVVSRLNDAFQRPAGRIDHPPPPAASQLPPRQRPSKKVEPVPWHRVLVLRRKERYSANSAVQRPMRRPFEGCQKSAGRLPGPSALKYGRHRADTEGYRDRAMTCWICGRRASMASLMPCC